ncbi:MAG: family N-acetyltransferase [Frankiales bacterium]|nr:family N-acetyltransferase [Frankiales bacterium]
MPLVPVTADLRDAVLALAPRPDQEVFSGRAARTLPAAEADPVRHPVAVVDDNGVPLGFFTLDETGGDVLLRGFFVDQRHQRQGRARGALAELPGHVRARFPSAPAVVLTVNVRNPGAYAVYLAAGFADTGELYLGGPAGPQHVLRLEL